MANEIAANPGIVLKGVKEQLNYMADHTPEEGLKYVAVWNAAFPEIVQGSPFPCDSSFHLTIVFLVTFGPSHVGVGR